MHERFASSPIETANMNTSLLRENYLVPRLMERDQFTFTYSHFDRMIIGGAVPTKQSITLGNYDQLKSQYFLERREMGIINVGGPGNINANGTNHSLGKLDCLYISRGTKQVVFSSADAKKPSHFFILSAPAHMPYETRSMKNNEATSVALGSKETANERTIYKYIHEDGIRSCQLVMGLTILNNGSVWNTMPPHTHNRRMEVYLYFDVPAEHRVFHFMGQSTETRHLIVSNEEAVISPPWSIHSGCGTTAYSFIWGMAGENQAFTDMDGVSLENIR